MKEQKSMVQLLKRYEGYSFNSFERFCFSVLLVYFTFMIFMFFILPKI